MHAHRGAPYITLHDTSYHYCACSDFKILLSFLVTIVFSILQVHVLLASFIPLIRRAFEPFPLITFSFYDDRTGMIVVPAANPIHFVNHASTYDPPIAKPFERLQ